MEEVSEVPAVGSAVCDGAEILLRFPVSVTFRMYHGDRRKERKEQKENKKSEQDKRQSIPFSSD